VSATAQLYFDASLTYVRALSVLRLDIGAGVTGTMQGGEVTVDGPVIDEKDLYVIDFKILWLISCKVGLVGGMDYEVTVKTDAEGILSTGYDIVYGMRAGFNIDLFE
jgi:hypothetical protein